MNEALRTSEEKSDCWSVNLLFTPKFTEVTVTMFTCTKYCLVFFAYSEKDNISVYRAKSNRTSCASSLASTLVWCGDASITTQQWKCMEKCTCNDSEHKTDWMWKNWDIVLKLHLLSLRHVRLLIIWRCCYL